MLRQLVRRVVGTLPERPHLSIPRGLATQGPGDESSSTASPAAGSDALPSTSSQDAQPVAAQQASEEAAAEPSREPGLRPLPELFDVVRASTRDDVGTIDKESLARLLGTSQSAAGSDAAKQDAPSARPGDRLFNACVGYAALGASRQESKAGAVAEHPRLHPRRLFRPGDMYDPQELNYLASGTQTRQRRERAYVQMTHRQVRVFGDHKNVAFLEHFLTPNGKIKPRVHTGLPVVAQKKVSALIKRARNIGLIAREAKPERRHLKHLRATEAAFGSQSAIGPQ